MERHKGPNRAHEHPYYKDVLLQFLEKPGDAGFIYTHMANTAITHLIDTKRPLAQELTIVDLMLTAKDETYDRSGIDAFAVMSDGREIPIQITSHAGMGQMHRHKHPGIPTIHTRTGESKSIIPYDILEDQICMELNAWISEGRELEYDYMEQEYIVRKHVTHP